MTLAQVSAEQFATRIQQFIAEEILRDDRLLDLDEVLLADGLVNSLGMMRLVGYLENEFEVSVALEQFTIENFRSIRTISEFVTTMIAKRDS